MNCTKDNKDCEKILKHKSYKQSEDLVAVLLCDRVITVGKPTHFQFTNRKGSELIII